MKNEQAYYRLMREANSVAEDATEVAYFQIFFEGCASEILHEIKALHSEMKDKEWEGRSHDTYEQMREHIFMVLTDLRHTENNVIHSLVRMRNDLAYREERLYLKARQFL